MEAHGIAFVDVFETIAISGPCQDMVSTLKFRKGTSESHIYVCVVDSLSSQRYPHGTAGSSTVMCRHTGLPLSLFWGAKERCGEACELSCKRLSGGWDFFPKNVAELGGSCQRCVFKCPTCWPWCRWYSCSPESTVWGDFRFPCFALGLKVSSCCVATPRVPLSLCPGHTLTDLTSAL